MGTKIKHVYLSACTDIITAGDYERLICLHLCHRTGIRMQPHYSACLLGEESKRSARVLGTELGVGGGGDRAACLHGSETPACIATRRASGPQTHTAVSNR